MAKLSQELISKAAQCKTIEEIAALAKAEGVTISPEDAQRFLEDADIEVNEEALEKVAGGEMNGAGTFGPLFVGYRTNC